LRFYIRKIYGKNSFESKDAEFSKSLEEAREMKKAFQQGLQRDF